MSASVSPAISEYLLYIYTQKRNKNIKKKSPYSPWGKHDDRSWLLSSCNRKRLQVKANIYLAINIISTDNLDIHTKIK